MKAEKLVTYCGGFCGTCARSPGYTAFRQAAALVGELVDAHGFRHWLPKTGIQFDFAEFRKGLDFFADPHSWLVCRSTCRGGSGGPPGCPRECCRKRGLEVCFECSEFPCAELKGNTRIADRARGYRKLGRQKWIRSQSSLAAAGFEGHTGKYYLVKIGKTARSVQPRRVRIGIASPSA